MTRESSKATELNLGANTGLFLLKIIAGALLMSLAIIADAINSLSDVVASLAVLVSVRMSAKKADDDHPFGHARAEPLAALLVAIFIGIVGFELIRLGTMEILSPSDHEFSLFGVLVLLGSMVVKGFMFRYFSRVGQSAKSPAVQAIAVDSRNDVATSFVALLGFVGAGIGIGFGFDYLEGVAALAIGVWVINSAVELSKENMDFLLGATPGEELMKQIKDRANVVSGVLSVHDVSAHYVGNIVHVEIHCCLDEKLTIQEAHDIVKEVKAGVETLESVDRAFIHIDPEPVDYQTGD